MDVRRPALVALLVGLALLASPAVLLQYEEPTECANRVEPTNAPDGNEAGVPVVRYEELSPDAKRAFDRARAADGSVVVYGERCPERFDYSADRARYDVVENGSRYRLTTYENDLVPEVAIASGVLAFLGLVLVGVGAATHDDPRTRLPGSAGVVGLVTLGVVTAAVVLDRQLWAAVAWTVLVTGVALVGAGVALRPRRALLLGGVLALLPGIVVLPLGGVSLVFLVPAVLPLALVGAGVAGKTLLERATSATR